MDTATDTLVAFHGDPRLKRRTLAQLARHHKADQIVQGMYWDEDDFSGCAVGCLTHDPNGGHDQFPERWGIPEVIAQLMDAIHEMLPAAQAREWPQRIMKAIPLGADLSLVWPHFAVWMLVDPTDGVIRFADERGAAAIRGVAELFEHVLAGENVLEATWAAGAARAAGAAWAAGAARMADQLVALCAAAPVAVALS